MLIYLSACSALQSKLDQLKALAEGNFVENFVKEFVPKDLEVCTLRPSWSAAARSERHP